MMKINEEMKKFCRYYKGESECPFDPQEQVAEWTFWTCERMYFDERTDRSSFEDVAQQYIDSHKNVENFMTSDAPIEQKGFVMFVEEYLRKWLMDVDLVFEYGK